MNGMVGGDLLDRLVAIKSGLWVRRLLNFFGEGFAQGGSPFQRCLISADMHDKAYQDKTIKSSLLNRGGP